MSIQRFVPVCNCKSCTHRGTDQFTNGMHKCEVYGRRFSLGYVCRYYERDIKGKDLFTNKDRQLAAKAAAQQRGANNVVGT